MATKPTEIVASTGRQDRPARGGDVDERRRVSNGAGRPALPEDLDPALFWKWVAKSLSKTSRPVVGWVLTGVGLLAIFLGWFGVSGSALVAKQLPFLISGGIGGIALVAIGAVILGTEDMRKDSGRLDRLEKQVADLHSILLARADAPEVSLAEQEASQSSTSGGRRPARSRNGEATQEGRPREPREEDDRDRYGAAAAAVLVALPGATTFHRPDCAMVAGKPEVESITEDVARGEGLKPCRLCDPAPTDE